MPRLVCGGNPAQAFITGTISYWAGSGFENAGAGTGGMIACSSSYESGNDFWDGTIRPETPKKAAFREMLLKHGFDPDKPVPLERREEFVKTFFPDEYAKYGMVSSDLPPDGYTLHDDGYFRNIEKPGVQVRGTTIRNGMRYGWVESNIGNPCQGTPPDLAYQAVGHKATAHIARATWSNATDAYFNIGHEYVHVGHWYNGDILNFQHRYPGSISQRPAQAWSERVAYQWSYDTAVKYGNVDRMKDALIAIGRFGGY